MRNLLVGMGIGVALCGLVAGMPAWADQPHMKTALTHLKQAADQLTQAKPNKGGHRERALEHVNSAIQQVQEGIDYVDK